MQLNFKRSRSWRVTWVCGECSLLRYWCLIVSAFELLFLWLHTSTIYLSQTQGWADKSTEQLNRRIQESLPFKSGVLRTRKPRWYWCEGPVYRTYTRIPLGSSARKHVVSIQQEVPPPVTKGQKWDRFETGAMLLRLLKFILVTVGKWNSVLMEIISNKLHDMSKI